MSQESSDSDSDSDLRGNLRLSAWGPSISGWRDRWAKVINTWLWSSCNNKYHCLESDTSHSGSEEIRVGRHERWAEVRKILFWRWSSNKYYCLGWLLTLSLSLRSWLDIVSRHAYYLSLWSVWCECVGFQLLVLHPPPCREWSAVCCHRSRCRSNSCRQSSSLCHKS